MYRNGTIGFRSIYGRCWLSSELNGHSDLGPLPGDVRSWYLALAENGRSMAAPPLVSDIDLFGEVERIVDLDTQISHGALNLGVAEQQLNGTQIPGAAINQGRFCAPQ